MFPVAGLGDLRNDNDPNCTYEGENNVLLQQTSNWLLSVRKKGYHQFAERSPLKTADILSNFDSIIKQKATWSSSKEAVDLQSKSKLLQHNIDHELNNRIGTYNFLSLYRSQVMF